MVNNDVEFVAMITDVTAMISKVNLLDANSNDWWIDTGATRHVWHDKSSFINLKELDDGQKLFMGNAATTDI